LAQTHDIIISAGSERQQKDRRQRQRYFADWLVETDCPWYLPDPDDYRDYLLNQRDLSPLSVANHVSTIRSTYQQLLERRDIKKIIAQSLPADIATDRDHAINEAVNTMWVATDKESGAIDAERKKRTASLSVGEVDVLLEKPDLTTGVGCRNIIIIGLIVCSGMNETEICKLTINDIQWADQDERLHITIKPADKQPERFIPIYDDLLCDSPWLEAAIKWFSERFPLADGHLFPGFRRDGNTPTGKPVSARSIQHMLKEYTAQDVTEITVFTLRQTYARRAYALGVDAKTLQENLGHKRFATTKSYIGSLDRSGAKRITPHKFKAGRMIKRFGSIVKP